MPPSLSLDDNHNGDVFHRDNDLRLLAGRLSAMTSSSEQDSDLGSTSGEFEIHSDDDDDDDDDGDDDDDDDDSDLRAVPSLLTRPSSDEESIFSGSVPSLASRELMTSDYPSSKLVVHNLHWLEQRGLVKFSREQWKYVLELARLKESNYTKDTIAQVKLLKPNTESERKVFSTQEAAKV